MRFGKFSGSMRRSDTAFLGAGEFLIAYASPPMMLADPGRMSDVVTLLFKNDISPCKVIEAVYQWGRLHTPQKQ